MQVNEYSVWLLPEAAQQQQLTAMVDGFARRFGGPPFIPHVTLQGDLTTPFADLSSAVAQIAAEFAVQHWPIARVEGTEHFFRSLFLRFDETNDCVAMKQRVKQASGTDIGLSPFPHISLAYGLTPSQQCAELYLEAMALAPNPIALDRIVIARSSKNVPIAQWECLAEFPLALRGATNPQ